MCRLHPPIPALDAMLNIWLSWYEYSVWDEWRCVGGGNPPVREDASQPAAAASLAALHVFYGDH